MGSVSDWEVMSAAAETLETFGVAYEKRRTARPTCWPSMPRRPNPAA